MSALGERWRVSVWNGTGVQLPATNINVRYRRWKFDSSGVYTPETSGQLLQIGASLAIGSGTQSSAITNNGSGEQWLGADFIVEFPAFTSTPNGSLEVYLQISTDGGTNWPDAPDVRRGSIIAAEFYNNVANPAAREVQSRIS